MRENRTPGSVRGASGNRRPYRDVRQAKLGASCQVQVLAEEGLTNHSYRVLQLWRKHDVKPNETVEAYTGNHVARRGARTPQSLRQPRK